MRETLLGAIGALLIILGTMPAAVQAVHDIDATGDPADEREMLKVCTFSHQNNTTGLTCDYNSIQAAVDHAEASLSNEDTNDTVTTIKVLNGTYDERVTVDVANLTLLGAQNSTDARERAASAGNTSEAVVDGGFVVAADGVTIDGFAVEGVTSGLAGGIQTQADVSGFQLVNNIIRANDLGILLRSSGEEQSNVTQNQIVDNDVGSGVAQGITPGFGPDATLSNALIADNRISGHTEGGNSYAIAFHAGGGADSDVTISGNEIAGSTVLLNEVSGFDISDNDIVMDDADSSTALFIGGGVDDLSVEGNVIDGERRSVYINTIFGSQNSDVSLRSNTIQEAEIGLEIDEGSIPAWQLDLRYNAFEFNSEAAIETDLTQPIDAEYNWWNAVIGPDDDGNPLTEPSGDEGIFAGGEEIRGDVDYTPWCLTSDCPSQTANEELRNPPWR